nr:hypothetical protein [Candidatus Bathyarchaeota archaeon]
MPYERNFKFKLRRAVRKLDTQELRKEAIEDLQSLAKEAYKRAKPKKGKKTEKSIKWTRITAYLHQVINSITKQYDERQIDKDLDKLERLIEEAHKRAENLKKKPEKEK